MPANSPADASMRNKIYIAMAKYCHSSVLTIFLGHLTFIYFLYSATINISFISGMLAQRCVCYALEKCMIMRAS